MCGIVSKSKVVGWPGGILPWVGWDGVLNQGLTWCVLRHAKDKITTIEKLTWLRQCKNVCISNTMECNFGATCMRGVQPVSFLSPALPCAKVTYLVALHLVGSTFHG